MSDILTVDQFIGDKWRPVDELRLELTGRWLSLELYSLLIPGYSQRPEVVSAIKEGLQFAADAPDVVVLTRGPAVVAATQELLDDFQRENRPKVSWKKLGDDFRWLCRDRNDLAQRGIPVSWIAERFHLPAFGVDNDVLWHARVGVHFHAGYRSVDEMHLLSDMFYLLVQARETVKLLRAAQDNHASLPKNDDEWYNVVTRVKSNACGYARQAVVTACSFVEAFVNGIGADFAARNPSLSAKDREFLSGRQNGRWVSLDRRLEGYPQLITGSKTPLFIVCDRGGRVEPFKTFFSKAVEVRDGAMHPAKGKAVIWLGAFEWLGLAESAVDTSLEVARLLWKTCKPAAPMPGFLWELDRAQLIASAERRVAATDRLQRAIPGATESGR